MAGAGVPPPGSATLVYLGVSPSLDAALARVSAAGGRVLKAKTALPPGMGFFAHVEDVEGNRVGVHAPA
jgi:predicted enzyme related to lactoylglutathione lyase